MMRPTPGALDQIAKAADVKTDKQLADFLGITVEEVEAIRYQTPMTPEQAVQLTDRVLAHRQAAELLDESKRTLAPTP